MTVDPEGIKDAETLAVAGPLLALTAVELAVLEQAHRAGLTAAAADAVVEASDQGVLNEARRSLLGRGLLGRDGRLATGTVPADLAELLLDTRLGASAIIIIERRIAGREDRPDLRMLHLIPEGGVIEDVHPDGLVGLDLHVDPVELVRAALAPVLPSDAKRGRGSTRTLDPARPELMAQVLDQPGVLAEITLAEPDGRRCESYLLAVGHSGCFLSRRTQDTELTDDDRPGARLLTFVPASPEEVEELITRWVDGVVRPLV